MTAPQLEQYLAQWSALHGGVRPRGLVGAWLRLAHLVVRPLAALRVPPWSVTLTGVALAALAIWPAATLPAVAALLTGLSGLCDGLDGSLALVGGRLSRLGSVLDAVCDRAADLCLAAALWRAGAPAWAALAAAGLATGHEYLRAVARLAGMAEVGAITVAERPSRLVVTGMFLLAAGTPLLTPTWWATAGALVLVVLGVAGLGQLSSAVRRGLGGASS